MQDQLESDKSLKGIFAIVAAGFLLRFGMGLGQDLWDDEVASLLIAQLSFSQLKAYYLSDPHPPLFYTLLKPWTWVSTSTTWLRLFPNLCGTATIYVVYAWVKRAAGEKPGLFAAALLAVAPFHVWASTELRSHSLVALLVCLGGYWCFRYLKESRRFWHLVIAIVFFVIAGWCHYFGAVAAIGFVLTLAIISQREYRDAKVAFIALAFGYLPWAQFLNSQMDNAQAFRISASLSDLIYSFGVMLGFSSFPWTPPGLLVFSDLAEVSWVGYLFAMAIPALVFWLVVPLGMTCKKSRTGAMIPGVIILATVIVTCIGNFITEGFEIRYMVFLVPLLCATAGIFYASINNGRLLFVFLLLCFVFADAEALFSPKFQRPDFSSQVAKIREEKGRAVVYNKNASPAFIYYSQQAFPIFELRGPYGTKIGDVEKNVAEILSAGGPLFQIIQTENLYDPGGRIERTLEARFGEPECRVLESAMPVRVCHFSPD